MAGADHQRHVPRAARVHARARAAAQSAGAPRRPVAFRSRRLAPPSAEGRWSLVRRDAAAGVDARRDATAWAAAHRAAAARAPRRRHARGGGGRIGRRAASAPSIRSSRRWKKPAASGAATSSPASAPRSSRCPARSTCCARCATRRTMRRRSRCWPRPIRPTRTARRSSGRRDDRRRAATRTPASVRELRGFGGAGVERRGRARADPIGRRHGDPRRRRARRAISRAAIGSCSRFSRTPSRSDRGSAAPSRAR